MLPLVLADAITGEGFLILGAVFGLLPLAAIVLIEWPIWRYFARLQGQPVVWTCLGANVLSSLLAIPLAIVFDVCASQWLKSDLHVYEQSFLRYSVFKYVIYLGLSIIVEGLVFGWRFRLTTSGKRVLLAAVYANFASYLVVIPIYYQLTKPRLSGAVFTSDTSWAQESPERITFIDRGTGYLVSCDLHGGSRQTLVTAAMDAYLLTPDQSVVLYRKGTELWWMKGERTEHVTSSLLKVRGTSMGMTDLDLSGRFVAYAAIVSRDETQWPVAEVWDIHVWDADARQDHVVRAGVTGWGANVLRWADAGRLLYVSASPVEPPSEEIALGQDGSVLATNKLTGTETPMAGCFGPLGRDTWRQRPYQIEFADQAGEWHVTSWSMLTNRYASVARGTRWHEPQSHETMCLDDNPGVYMVWAHVRACGDFAFVPGTQVAVLEDLTNRVLYLVDPATGRVGKLAEGSDFILHRDRYRRGLSDGGLGPWAIEVAVPATRP